MLVGLIASLALILIGPHTGGFREQAAFMMSLIDFDQTVLHGMLGFLLFAGAIHIKLDELAQAIASISLLAILGILASIFITGGLTWLVLGGIGLSIPFMHATLFGALIWPTDPINVMDIIRSVGAPKQLEIHIAGESLFNDGIGAVIFLVLLVISGISTSPATTIPSHPVGFGDVTMHLLKEVGGALILGLAAGMFVYQLTESRAAGRCTARPNSPPVAAQQSVSGWDVDAIVCLG